MNQAQRWTARLVGALRIMPALSALALLALLGGNGACGRSVFPTATASPTATSSSTAAPTPGTGAFLYVGNNTDGTISEYQRSSTTGALSSIGTVPAGVSKGPVGLASNPSGKFLYVANPGDGLHQFKINQSSGALTALSANNGLVTAGDAPEGLAISQVGAGTFAYAPNFASASISQYMVEASGKLQSKGTVTSALLANPFAAAATSHFLYVSDNTNGTVVSFPINGNGTLAAAQASTTPSSSQAVRNPVVVLLDPTASFLYVSDQTTGFVSVFSTAGGALSALLQSVQSTTLGGAVGLAIAAINGTEFLYVANQMANSISLNIVNTSTGLLTPAGVVFTALATPTGLVVGSSSNGSFLYAANQGGASVMQFTINPINGSLSNPVTIASGAGPQFLAIPSP